MKLNLKNDQSVNSLKDVWAVLKAQADPALNYVKSNPATTAALGLGGAANLAGLLDDNGIGGQLLGAGLGGAASFLAPKALDMAPLPTQTKIALTLAGGGLGSLFDTLRSKKEQQAQYANQINTGAY